MENKDTAPQIFCRYNEKVSVDKLIPHPRNPNTHPAAQIVMLSKIIRVQGWRAPITVSKRSGFIVRGHGRLLAARLLDLKEVPVEYQEYKDEATEWADLVADNKLAEFSIMDEEMLKGIAEELKAVNFDMELAGITTADMERVNAAGSEATDGTIIDGFHRYMLSRESKELRAKYNGLVPCAVVDITSAEARIMTINMNRAKGTHVALRMAGIVQDLIDKQGLTKEQVAAKIGAPAEEVDILYDNSIFKHKNLSNYRYSKAWLPGESKNDKARQNVTGAKGADNGAKQL